MDETRQAFMQMAALARAKAMELNGGEYPSAMTETQINANLNAVPSILPGSMLAEMHCDICGDKGYILKADGISLVSQECKCMTRRKSLRRMRESGLIDLLGDYSFQSYTSEEKWQENIKQTAIKYLKNPVGHWFVITGTPGSGKTHICTAICSQLIEGGKEVRYMLWRDEAPRLKAMVNERDDYERAMNQYKTVDVLYIDDFFKGTQVTAGDINLAFELLNARYNSKKLITLISCERSIEELLNVDEAIGSRIYERSKGFLVKTKSGANYRLRG